MADLFGGIPVIPDWLTTNARFQSIAQGQATARNFMDAYNQAANRKQRGEEFKIGTQLDKERIQIERDREKARLAEAEANRKLREEIAERNRLEFKQEQEKLAREAEARRRSELAAGALNDNVAAYQATFGKPPDLNTAAKMQALALQKYDPEKYAQMISGIQKSAQALDQLGREIKTESGQTLVQTGPSSATMVRPVQPKSEPAAGTVDIYNAKGDKIGTKKVSAEELKQIEAEAQKPASGKKIPPEGTIAINPQTGKRMIVKDGKWQPL